MPSSAPHALLMLGNPEDHPDLLHASGFRAPDETLFITIKRKKWLVVSSMEINRARRTCQHLTVLSPAELHLPPRTHPVQWAIALLEREQTTHCQVPDWLPLKTARTLEQAGITLDTDDGRLLRERALKSEREIEALATTQRAAVSAMKQAATALRQATIHPRDHSLMLANEPLTSERLRALIEVHLLEQHNCTTNGNTIVACATQTADPHEQGTGILRAQQPILIDIFPRSRQTGYHGDLTRTFVKGTPPPEIRRMHQAVTAAHTLALSMVRPGIKARTIHRAVIRTLEQHGFPLDPRKDPPEGFIHGTGHGVGLDIHELPRINSASTATLRTGHVVTIEPGLYYPRIGGVRIEDLIAVTPHGYRLMAHQSNPLTI